MDGVLLVLAIIWTIIQTSRTIANTSLLYGFYYLVGAVIIWTPVLIIVHFIVKYW